ncbi:MAG: DEAD/DEAH box helicase [Candidatus Colwellbacteria bacterium]|nr:DEAD/DEAH box helicase [Candidatus Colwellbacteria bacterium]
MTASFCDESKFIKRASPAKPAGEVKIEHNFADFKVSPRLKENVLSKGYERPTLIQDRAIPEILNGSDLIGIANTGTGKTAAFLIPLIEKTIRNKEEKSLIVAPTRELAEQINIELKDFSKGMPIYSTVAVGGMNIRFQINSLRRGSSFVIGTPGRLNDLVKRKCLNMRDFSNVVLDEADRMLDMGFIADIRNIFSGLRQERQTIFFSATISKEVESLTSSFLKSPVMIRTKTGDTADNIDQDVIRFNRREEKMDILHNFLIKEEFKKVLIFGETKRGVQGIHQDLSSRGFKTASIHGDKTQNERRIALRLFKEEKVNILVATDVAARGIDVPDVSHVINYDLPHTYDDYVHRIGRTGRAEHKGTALTFVRAGENTAPRSPREGFRRSAVRQNRN